MDLSWVAEAAKQIPALLVLVFLIHKFLKYLIKRDEALEGISEQCHKVQRDAIEAIKQNSRALGEVSVLLKRLNGANR